MADDKNLAVIADNIEFLAVIIARCTRALIEIQCDDGYPRKEFFEKHNIEDDMAVRKIFLENQDKEVR